MKRKSAALLLVVTILFSGGCGTVSEPQAIPAPAPTPPPVSEVITPKAGGNLKLSMRLPKTLNPLLNQDITVDTVLKLIFEDLAVLDENRKPQPNLADSFDFASDGSGIIVHLRQDVYWSDGEPMTADDLIFTLDFLTRAPEGAIYKNVVENIGGVVKQDTYTVKINYVQAYSGSAYLLCFPIIPKHYYMGETKQDSEKNMAPLGNGMYTFVSYRNVKDVTLAASENSFRRKPYISDITVVITPDAETDLYSFDQDVIDVVSAKIADWGKYRGTKDSDITEYSTNYFDFIGFNFNNIFLNDIKVRQAIAYATPVDQILDEIYLFHALKAAVPVNPESWLYNPEVTAPGYNMDAAYSLLLEAGFTESEEVMQWDLNGVKMDLVLNILVNEENEERVKIAAKLRKSLRDLKIISEVEAVPFDEFEERVKEGQFDLFVGGFNLSVIPDLSFAFKGGENYFEYHSENMDLLLEQARNAVGDLNYKKAMGEVQKQVAADLPIISLVFRKYAVLRSRKVMGGVKPVLNNIFADINQWFIYEENE